MGSADKYVRQWKCEHWKGGEISTMVRPNCAVPSLQHHLEQSSHSVRPPNWYHKYVASSCIIFNFSERILEKICRFLVDNIPVREILYNDVISSVYPSKPMSVYATIWDGSEWATHGGKYPVDYKYAPFVASFGEMEMNGCIFDPKKQDSSCAKGTVSSRDPVDGEEFAKLSEQQRMGMDWARKKLMFYSYCKDSSIFKVLPPECKAK